MTRRAVVLGLSCWPVLFMGHLARADDLLDIPLISPGALRAALGASAQSVRLYDVRELAEFRVSRLLGAIRVDPTADDEDFVRRIASTVDGKRIVFYCSIGPRAETFALNAAPGLLKAGAAHVELLDGGLFAWANANYPLVDDRGATTAIHPSPQDIARFLHDPSRLRDTPRP